MQYIGNISNICHAFWTKLYKRHAPENPKYLATGNWQLATGIWHMEFEWHTASVSELNKQYCKSLEQLYKC